jgi:hypothetical protein
MLISAPRIMGTAYDSFVVQYHKVGHAFHGGSALTGVIGIVQMAILVLPALALVATFWMFFRRIAGAVWSRTEGNDTARAAFVAATAVAAGALAYIWWPNGNYRPVVPGERGTLAGAVHQFTGVVARHRQSPGPVSTTPTTTSTNATSTNQTTTTEGTTQTQTSTSQTTTGSTPGVNPGPGTSTTPTPTDTTPTDTTPTLTDTTPTNSTTGGLTTP